MRETGVTTLDEALVDARSGGEAGFLLLWDALQPRLLRYLRVVGCDDVEDVAGETWLQVVRDLPKFKRDTADEFRAWLFTIARHRAIDAARSRRRFRDKVLAAEPLPPLVTPGSPVEDEVFYRAFHAAGRRHRRRAVQGPGGGGGAARDRGTGHRGRRPHLAQEARCGPCLAAVGAVAVVAAGVAAAAYTQALPGPAQDLAHTVFAPLGVPANQSGHSADLTIATSGGTPSPRPGDDYRLTLTASRLRVPAGTAVAFARRVTEGGAGAADVPVRLFERLAGTTTWQLVASGVTGPRGGFRLESPPLTATGVFRMVGPDAKHSAAVRVTVVPLPRESKGGLRLRVRPSR